MDKVKTKRAESFLRELVQEALSNLEDGLINGLCVTQVECSRGKYDATVFIDPSFVEDKNLILKHLKKASPIIQDYCFTNSGWYKTPKLHFKFDDSVEHIKKLDEIFKKIKEC